VHKTENTLHKKILYHIKTEMEHVHVLNSRAIQLLLGKLRDVKTDQPTYMRVADCLCDLLAMEALCAEHLTANVKVQTPCGVADTIELKFPKICAVSILRSGDILAEAVRRNKIVDCVVGKILIQRDEKDPEKKSRLFYEKLPGDISRMPVILCDPMLATGGSAINAVEVLLKHGVREDKITFANIVCCPEGLKTFTERFPGLRVITTTIDNGLNDEKFILPGLGDFGDRYFGTISK